MSCRHIRAATAVWALTAPILLVVAITPATAAEKDIDKVIPRKNVTPAPKVKRANPVKRARPRARPMPRVRSSIAREIIRKAKAKAAKGDTCKKVRRTHYKNIKKLAPFAKIGKVYLHKSEYFGSCTVSIFTRKTRYGVAKDESFCLYYNQYFCGGLSLKCGIAIGVRVCKTRRGPWWRVSYP